MSACGASAAAYAGELPIAADTVDTARMGFACSVSADRVHSQTRRRGIRRAARRFARLRVGSPCSRLALHFAGLGFALGTVLVGRGGTARTARVVVEVVRGLPGRSVEQNYNTAVVVPSPTSRWMWSWMLARVLPGMLAVRSSQSVAGSY